MQPWRNESSLLDYVLRTMNVVADECECPMESRENVKIRSEHINKLQRLHGLIEQVDINLNGNDQDSKLMEKLVSYIQRLRSFNIAQSAEDQFTQLYALRKWLFWVPVDLLQARRNDPSALLVLAYFFTTMLELVPIFPDVGAAFGADLAISPLEEVLTALNRIMPARSSLPFWQMIVALMKFPQKVAAEYRNLNVWTKQQDSAETFAPTNPVFQPESLNIDVVQQLNNYQFCDGREAFRDSPLSQFGNEFPDINPSLVGPPIPTSDQSDYGFQNDRTSFVGGRDLGSRASFPYGASVDRLVTISPETRRSNFTYDTGVPYPYSSAYVKKFI